MKRFDSAKWITENKLVKEAINPKSNLKDTPAETIVNGMLSGDENNEVLTMIKAFSADALSAEETKQWALNIGREKLMNRISTAQEAIPTIAPSKSEMPALEPENAAAVKDALDDNDGGMYAIDISEPFAPIISKEDIRPDFNDPHFPTDLDDNPQGKDWLQKGKQDGQEGDDKIEVKTGESMTVGDMTPTQSNIEIGKSLFFATKVVPTGNLDKLDAFATDKANGSAILDGHHRWSGQYIANGEGKSLTGVITVAAPAEKAIPILRSIGNALGNAQKEGSIPKTKAKMKTNVKQAAQEANDPRSSLYERLEKHINKEWMGAPERKSTTSIQPNEEDEVKDILTSKGYEGPTEAPTRQQLKKGMGPKKNFGSHVGGFRHRYSKQGEEVLVISKHPSDGTFSLAKGITSEPESDMKAQSFDEFTNNLKTLP